MTDSDADIVVAGAGHNSLLAACYLAKAGYRCLVLDARPVPGGGAATEELLLPGFGIDTCATGHTMIRVNPALLHDELGLAADYGLRYAEPDPVAQVAFPDGRQLTMWLDRDRTADEIARFSAADAQAYLRLLDEYDQVKHIFSETQFTPVGYGPGLEARLHEHPRGRIWARRRQLSAVQVVQHEFTSRHIQAFLLWMAFQVFQPVDEPGSGVLPYAQTFGRQQRSWSIPIGGSGQLTAALTGYLADHGGTVRCGQRVTRLLLDGGRCTGVRTADGTEYRAGTAVLSTIHVQHLRDMAPRAAWPEEFHYGVDTYDVGVPGFATYYCATAAPQFRAPDGPRSAVSAGLAGWPEDCIQLSADLRTGRFSTDPPWVLVATPTLADPGRAPAGQHTVKILSPQVYQPGPGGWADAQARALPAPATAAANGGRLPGRGHPGQPGQVAGGHRAAEPAHDPRRVPRREPGAGVQRPAPARTGLGGAPDAHPRPVPDRRVHPPGRLHHRRAGAERGHRHAVRPGPRPGRGAGLSGGPAGGRSAAPGLSRRCPAAARPRPGRRRGRPPRPRCAAAPAAGPARRTCRPGRPTP